MQRNRCWRLRVLGALVALTAMMVVASAAVALAAPADQSAGKATWKNEGFDAVKGWTPGEIGPYQEGDLVPFRVVVTNPSKSQAAVLRSFAVQVNNIRKDVAVFDRTSAWTGPVAPATQDVAVDGMLRTTFPAGVTLAPGGSATFTFLAHVAVTTATQPAAGSRQGNGVDGFSELDTAGDGTFGKRVPVKVGPGVQPPQPASASGSVFLDYNRDGIWEPGEPPMAGWTIELKDASGAVIATVLTDDLGAYSFAGLTPGAGYTIEQVLQPSWLQSAPAAPGGFTFTPSAGQQVGPCDFGDYIQDV